MKSTDASQKKEEIANHAHSSRRGAAAAAAATERDPLLPTGLRSRRNSPSTSSSMSINNAQERLLLDDENDTTDPNTVAIATTHPPQQMMEDGGSSSSTRASPVGPSPTFQSYRNAAAAAAASFETWTEEDERMLRQSRTVGSTEDDDGDDDTDDDDTADNSSSKVSSSRRRGRRGDEDDSNTQSGDSASQPSPLLEIPEEIYAVRRAALQVLKPLTKTWVIVSVGFALTVLFGMARWTRLLPGIPFWFILLPCWSAHVGLLWLHILSAQALSQFIAHANAARQRPDSRDHLNRTEYLPLLQRSLKLGLKTGVMSFLVFLFEILIFLKLSRHHLSLAVTLTPLWLLVLGGILDGLICKSQHVLRVVCWILTFVAMVLMVMKVDYHWNGLRWRAVISPIIAVLSISSGTLVYIIYGHQVGYYRLTESQLTAGNLYSLAALVCIVLVVMIGEVIPLTRPVEVETRLLVVMLAPLIICLVGMGAWVVSRDEYSRLLLYGGQAAVHPKKLRWESRGWTSVQGKGVTVIPMFGEVSFRPLERHSHFGKADGLLADSVTSHQSSWYEMCTLGGERGGLCGCCSIRCYPYEDDDAEEDLEAAAAAADSSARGNVYDMSRHPYLNPGSSSRRARHHLANYGLSGSLA